MQISISIHSERDKAAEKLWLMIATACVAGATGQVCELATMESDEEGSDTALWLGLAGITQRK